MVRDGVGWKGRKEPTHQPEHYYLMKSSSLWYLPGHWVSVGMILMSIDYLVECCGTLSGLRWCTTGMKGTGTRIEWVVDSVTQPPRHHPIPMPGGYIPTLETKQRECWKVYPRLTRDFDSRVHGQPSILVSGTCWTWLMKGTGRRW